MPESSNKKNEEKKNQNELRIFETASKAFTGPFVNEASKFLMNTAGSVLPVLTHSLLKSPLTATVGAIISHSVQSGTKRKAESSSTEKMGVGEKEGPDGFQYVYDNYEITNKRPRVVDNFVGREEELQRLEEKFNIIPPQTVDNFTGREKEMQGLEANFKKNCSIQVLTSQVSITGLGGIGKTQLAAKFVERNKEKYKNIFWIDAENYCIQDSFEKLAKKIGVKEGEEKNVNDVYEKINSLDNQKTKTLIVFDNIDDYDSVKGFLPHSDYGAIHVFITSRYNKWQNTEVHPMPLNVFTNEESSRFIKQELKIEENNNLYGKGIEELAEKLQGLPLALQQAVAYIKQQRTLNSNFGIQDYLEKYDKSYEETERLLDLNLNECNNDPYMKTVMTTWKVTLDKIASDTKYGKEAIRILSVMAYLVPDNIQNSMFSRLVEENKVTGAINLLRNYSMINEGSKLDLSSIHRLVQEVIRIKLETEEVEKETLEDVLKILKPVNFYSRTPNTNHAILIFVHASKYDKLNEINSSIPGLKLEKESTESLLQCVIKENRVDTMQYILDNMEDKWKKDNEHTLNQLLEYSIKKENKNNRNMIKVLIQHGARVSTLSMIRDNSFNPIKLLQTLKESEKLDKKEKLECLVEAIQNKNQQIIRFFKDEDKDLMLEDDIFNLLVKAIVDRNQDLVKTILENEPSLIKVPLKEEKKAKKILCYPRIPYSCSKAVEVKVKKGSSLLELAQAGVSLFPELDKQMKEILKKIEQEEKKKEEDKRKAEQPQTLGDEMESDTKSLLSVGNEDSDFEMINLPSNTSDDEEELLDLDYIVVDSGDSTPKNTLHSPSVTFPGQIHSRRY